jgi:hypothetical protein
MPRALCGEAGLSPEAIAARILGGNGLRRGRSPAAAGWAKYLAPSRYNLVSIFFFLRRNPMHISLPLRLKFATLLTIFSIIFLSLPACNSLPFLASTETTTATYTTTPINTSTRAITPTYTPTPTNTSTSTITPTLTPSLTPTVTLNVTSPLPPKTSYLDWPVVLSDTFDNNHNGWPTGPYEDEGKYIVANISISGGKYFIQATQIQGSEGMFWGFTPVINNLSDFYVSVDILIKSAPTNSCFGLILRDQDGNDYYFAIYVDLQLYTSGKHYKNEWTLFNGVYATDSTLINPGRSNQIAILAVGSHFTWLINGEEVETIEDNTLEKLKPGIGFSLGNAGDSAEIEFDNFEVRVPNKNP